MLVVRFPIKMENFPLSDSLGLMRSRGAIQHPQLRDWIPYISWREMTLHGTPRLTVTDSRQKLNGFTPALVARKDHGMARLLKLVGPLPTRLMGPNQLRRKKPTTTDCSIRWEMSGSGAGIVSTPPATAITEFLRAGAGPMLNGVAVLGCV